MKPLVELNNICFSVGEKQIINSVSTAIFPGEFVVILGGNGSGKSTLLKLINRTYQQTSGTILFKNKPIASYDFKSLKKEMVTITQFISDSIFLELTVEENATLIESQKIPCGELSHYLAQFNPTLSQALKTRVKNLSGGEQQMLAFALYLRHQPDLLLLDENTSALDPKKSDQVIEFTHDLVQKNKLTCLMTTHELNYALQYGTRLIAIHDGKIIFDVKDAEKKSLSMTDLLKNCY